MANNETVNITEDEAALYDRQIRLWGLDAQRRLRAARALLVGVSGLGAEVAKNIVLSGVKSLTLLDHAMVSAEDACSQFLVDRKDIGKNRAQCSLERTQQLNPMVEVSADTDNMADKSEDFFKDFDVICVTCCTKEQMIKLNDITHDNNIMFFAGDIFGYYGYMFADLNEHEFAEEIQKKKKVEEKTENDDGEPAAKKGKTEEMETIVEKKCCSFTRMKNALKVEWDTEKAQKSLKRTPNTYFIMQVLLRFRDKYLRDPDTQNLDEDRKNLLELRDTVLSELKVKQDFVEDSFSLHCFAELSPVCAIVGGILGQEIIKAVSQKDKPHNNFFFFNGVEGSGMVDKIGY